MARGKNTVARRQSPNSPGARVEAQYFHAGPLPDPQSLQRYDDIVPGAAERIIVLAEKQASHRQKIERRVVWINGGAQLLGMILGAVIVLEPVPTSSSRTRMRRGLPRFSPQSSVRSPLSSSRDVRSQRRAHAISEIT